MILSNAPESAAFSADTTVTKRWGIGNFALLNAEERLKGIFAVFHGTDFLHI